MSDSKPIDATVQAAQDGSQPYAWRYLVEAETDNSADVADHR